jgi:hypothetical protein
LQFTTKHKIFSGGFLKATIPNTFTISSQSTAAAQFEVSKGGKNYMGVYAVDLAGRTYTGLAKEDMAAGEVYTIKLAGI